MYKLIITADDFGMCESVNKAIIDCIDAGVVLSTNVMTNMESANDLTLLKRYGNEISVGIHWTLTTGKPVLNPELVPSLVGDNGEFLESKEFRSAVKRGKINKTELRNELTAQYEKFTNIYGNPAYWNSHENIHVNLHLFKFFVNLAAALNIRKMRCYNFTYVKSMDGTKIQESMIRKVKIQIINYWNSYAKKKGMYMPDGVLVFAEHDERYSLDKVYSNIQWKAHEQVVEMVVHPSTDTKCEFFGNITEGRVKEYQMCHNADLVNLLSSNNIKIIHFDQIKHSTEG